MINLKQNENLETVAEQKITAVADVAGLLEFVVKTTNETGLGHLIKSSIVLTEAF